MNVLSVFDGMSCGQIALHKAGFKNFSYFASEIDEHAKAVTLHNFPTTKMVGDVTKLTKVSGALADTGKIDLFMGGSPCQSISNLGDGSGLDGKSGLFFHWLRLKEELNPKWWLLENVKGNKKAIQQISEFVGAEPIEINSNLFSAQNRSRLYWTNIPVPPLPSQECSLSLKDVLDLDLSMESVLTEARLKWLTSEKGRECVKKRYASIDPSKAACLTARSDASWNCNYVTRDGVLTKLSPTEYERLQTVPEGYTASARTSERYKMLGNGWTVDVIAHILRGMTNEH